METYAINKQTLGESIDSLAIVMTLSPDGAHYRSNWMNLKNQTSLDLTEYEESNDFENAKSAVIFELKTIISDQVEYLHRQYSRWGIGARYKITSHHYHHHDGETYQQITVIERDNENNISLIDAEFSLNGSYFDDFKKDIPLGLN